MRGIGPQNIEVRNATAWFISLYVRIQVHVCHTAKTGQSVEVKMATSVDAKRDGCVIAGSDIWLYATTRNVHPLRL